MKSDINRRDYFAGIALAFGLENYSADDMEMHELILAAWEVADGMLEYEYSIPENQADKEPDTEEPEPAPVQVEEPAMEPVKPLTIAGFRVRLSNLAKRGKRDACLKALADCGVDRLPDLPEGRYARLDALLEQIEDGDDD